MVKKQDTLFASPLLDMVDFRFDERVVNVFPDMIQRSVPGYGTLISMIGVLAGKHFQAGSYCYDLGCSLGAVSLCMQQHIGHAAGKIIAVDNSAAMIKKASQLQPTEQQQSIPIEFICADLQDIVIQNASIVVMNFTLQFIPVAERMVLLQRIYDGMRDGGILVLSEKLTFTESEIDDFLIAAHHDFKKANGYSDLEISRKRSALENVLIPETLETHKNRLKQAGFAQSMQWFQCFNFASMVAVK